MLLWASQSQGHVQLDSMKRFSLILACCLAGNLTDYTENTEKSKLKVGT